jgi:hypothetical protein
MEGTHEVHARWCWVLTRRARAANCFAVCQSNLGALSLSHSLTLTQAPLTWVLGWVRQAEAGEGATVLGAAPRGVVCPGLPAKLLPLRAGLGGVDRLPDGGRDAESGVPNGTLADDGGGAAAGERTLNPKRTLRDGTRESGVPNCTLADDGGGAAAGERTLRETKHERERRASFVLEWRLRVFPW